MKKVPYCSKCGVEVNLGIINCPLCTKPIQKFDEEKITIQEKYPDEPVLEPDKRPMSVRQKQLRAWEILGVTLLIPFFIVVFTDLIPDATVSWAKWPMISLLLVWLLATFPLVFPKRPVIVILGEASSIMLFLILVDYFDNLQFDWFYQIALSIIALVTGIFSILVFLSIRAKKKGFNIAAYILFAIGIGNLCLDLIIMSSIRGQVTITWSLFVLVPTMLIGGFLLYLHHRFTRNTDLANNIKRKLHF